MQRVELGELKTIKTDVATIIDADSAEKSKECCYNKNDECQLGYGKCSSINKCFTLE